MQRLRILLLPRRLTHRSKAWHVEQPFSHGPVPRALFTNIRFRVHPCQPGLIRLCRISANPFHDFDYLARR